MSIARLILVFCFSMFTVVTWASELEVSIRPHRQQIVFGDPLYVEVTIVNRGLGLAAAPNAHPDVNTFTFRAVDPSSDLETRIYGSGGGGFGGAGTHVYHPGRPVRHYWYFLSPDIIKYERPFWKPLQGGASLLVGGVYNLRPGLSLSSNVINITLSERNQRESEALRKWMPTGKIDVFEPGPNGASFGLQFLAPLIRDQVLEAAVVFKDGEIADLLQLTLWMQTLYRLPDEARATENERLVEWLQKQVDIKRQALTIASRNIAGGNNMQSTQQALDKLIADPGFASNAGAPGK